MFSDNGNCFGMPSETPNRCSKCPHKRPLPPDANVSTLEKKSLHKESVPILLIIQRKAEYIECIDVEQAIYHRKVCNDMK